MMARYFSFHIDCHNKDRSRGDDSIFPPLLSQESCRQLHQPANVDISPYGYGWICEDNSARQWANGLTCTHDGSNTLNYYRVWLAFGIDRVLVGFTNSGRESNLNKEFQMVDGAITKIILSNEEDCQKPYDSLLEKIDSRPDDTFSRVQFSSIDDDDNDDDDEMCTSSSSNGWTKRIDVGLKWLLTL